MDIDSLADRLAGAVRSGAAIQPLTSDVDLNVDAAYDVQEALLARLEKNGAHAAPAAKLGLTSRAKQRQMGVEEPLYGWYLSGSALDIGEVLLTSELIQPRVEPEIAFLTDGHLAGADVTAAHVLAATAAVMPALDVLDSRFAGYQFTLPDVVADNASAARYLVGSPVAPDGIELSLLGCVLEHNGAMVDTAAGAAVLGHPAAAVAWLVRKLASRGKELPAGSLVLAGALTSAIPISAGDVVRVVIDRIGSVELRCE